MAIIRIGEIRKKSEKELDEKLDEFRKEMMRLKTQMSTGAPEKPGRVREIRKAIARIETVKKERGTN